MDLWVQIHSLQYRIQHESIPLTEEKQIIREIKQLEGTREKVIANAAMRAKIQDSLGQKEAIQDQVKVRQFYFELYCFRACHLTDFSLAVPGFSFIMTYLVFAKLYMSL